MHNYRLAALNKEADFKNEFDELCLINPQTGVKCDYTPHHGVNVILSYLCRSTYTSMITDMCTFTAMMEYWLITQPLLRPQLNRLCELLELMHKLKTHVDAYKCIYNPDVCIKTKLSGMDALRADFKQFVLDLTLTDPMDRQYILHFTRLLYQAHKLHINYQLRGTNIIFYPYNAFEVLCL